VALAPDLVVVNKEENRREDCEALAAAGLRLHVTHPRSVAAAIAMLRELGDVLAGLPAPGGTAVESLPGPAAAAHRLADRCDAALAAVTAAARGQERPSVFCPIWRNPWMTFHDRTYVGDVLAVVGLRNVFGACTERDFFEVDLAAVLARRPRVVILPDEPYVFTSKHADELREAGLASTRFVLIDGKDLAWYGPRIPDALRRLAEVARLTDSG
jgi:ABC-type Fe3+-hydroxamate transport system substrate-binding protein